MPLTVLIVDDDERFRELVKRLLGPGVRVVGEAARGDDAVLLATEVRPDVVLMDLEIPDLDGIAATRQIKAAVPRTKVILVTPHGEEAYLSSTGKTGADDLLAKRAVRSEVLPRIRAVVGRFGSAWDGMERRGPGVTWGRWHGSERRRPRPSGETGEPVKEPSTLRRPKELLERVARKASLVFDSFRQPLPAGVRVIGPSARRLLYKAGRYRVRLRLEPGADSEAAPRPGGARLEWRKDGGPHAHQSLRGVPVATGSRDEPPALRRGPRDRIVHRVPAVRRARWRAGSPDERGAWPVRPRRREEEGTEVRS